MGSSDIEVVAFKKYLIQLIVEIPVRITMSCLRAVLGQSIASNDTIFKVQCGQILTECVMQESGVQTTIEVLLGSVDKGNTQARMKVAGLVTNFSLLNCLVYFI